MKIKNPKLLVLALLIPQAAGIIGSIFTTPNIPSWYAGLIKPSFNPPNFLFAPVWTTLFLLMGISLYLVWIKGLSKKNIRFAFTIFMFQLILNILWSLLFFGMRSPQSAFYEIVILWIFIAYTIYLFAKINIKSAVLLVPYILWVSFAAILNFTIWRLN